VTKVLIRYFFVLIPMEVACMFHPNKALLARANFVIIVALSLLTSLTAATCVYALDATASDGALTSQIRSRQLIAVKSTPLVANGTTLGTVVVYDDPTTARTEDYLEIYNREGDLLAVAWFDRFGIQRVAVDRAFVDGKDQVEGVFIAVVDGDFV
jgi:hypothetical protein